MTKEEFELGLERVAQIQREAGWSDESIQLYADEQRFLSPDEALGCILMVGAGLACDNSRFGVYK